MAIEDIAKSLENAAAGLRTLEADLEAKVKAWLGDDSEPIQDLVVEPAPAPPEVVSNTSLGDSIDAAFGTTEEPPAPDAAEPLADAAATNVHASDEPKPGEGPSVQVPVEEPSPATLATAVEAPSLPPQAAEETNVHPSDAPKQGEGATLQAVPEPEPVSDPEQAPPAL